MANRLLKRIRDYMEVKKHKLLNQKTVSDGLKYLGIDEKGLTYMDKKILHLMQKEFNSGPVGIDALAASLNEDTGTIGRCL